MTCQRSWYSDFKELSSSVILGDDSIVQATGIGTITLSMKVPEGKVRCILTDVLYVPSLKKNLFSIPKAAQSGAVVTYYSQQCIIEHSESGQILGIAHYSKGLYTLQCDPVIISSVPAAAQAYAATKTPTSLDLLHQRLGHIGIERLKAIATSSLLLSKQDINQQLQFCDGCAQGKQHRLKIGKGVVPRASKRLQLVTSDICGPFPPSLSGAAYFATFNDSHSRRTVVALLQKKSQVLDKFKTFESTATMEVGLPIETFRSDQGGEYTSHAFVDFLYSKGIRRQNTDPGTPEQNSLAERRGGILVMMASCMMHHANLPAIFWAEAISLACFINNRAPTKALGLLSPEEVWTGKSQSLDNIKVFGCRAWSLDQRTSRKKLDPRSFPCIYLGPSTTSPGHRLYNFNTKRVIISRNVLFDELTLGLPQGNPAPSNDVAFLQMGESSLPLLIPITRQPPALIQLGSTAPEDLTTLDFEEFNNPASPDAPEGTASSSGDRQSPLIVPDDDLIDLRPIQHSSSSGSMQSSYQGSSPLLDFQEFHQPAPDIIPAAPIVPPCNASGSCVDDLQGLANASHASPTWPGLLPDSESTMNPPSSAPAQRPRSASQSTGNPRQSSRTPVPRKHLVQDEYFCNIATNSAILHGEPDSFKAAMSSSEAEDWHTAMQQEIDSLHRNNTWELVPLPPGRKPIQSRWVYRLKMNADGSINRFKARHVAKGYTQKEGIDYDETFAPVARFSSLRAVIALAAAENLELHQMDVDTAFLYGELKEEIYVTQPEGFINPLHPNHVCRLKKSLYGLKQAPRVWFETIDSFLKEHGFYKVHADPCIYIFITSSGKAIIFLYVDDLLIAATFCFLDPIKLLLNQRFRMKDLGEAKSLLNIEIIRDRKKGQIILRQSGYIKSILSYFNMSDCKPISTPMEVKSSLPSLLETPATASNIPYRQAIGKLIYAASGTRPDIAFATSILSRHLQAFNHQHWDAVKRILRYLQGTIHYGLVFSSGGSNPLILEGYSDADWAGDVLDRKSTSAYLFMLGGAPISWMSKKQATIALSSTEAEYLATTQAAKEALWLRSLLADLGHPQQQPTTIHEDNQGCIALSKNPVFHARTKHLDVQAHFIRHQVKANQVTLEYCPTQDMVADFLTKPLHQPQLVRLCQLAGITPEAVQRS